MMLRFVHGVERGTRGSMARPRAHGLVRLSHTTDWSGSVTWTDAVGWRGALRYQRCIANERLIGPPLRWGSTLRDRSCDGRDPDSDGISPGCRWLWGLSSSGVCPISLKLLHQQPGYFAFTSMRQAVGTLSLTISSSGPTASTRRAFRYSASWARLYVY